MHIHVYLTSPLYSSRVTAPRVNSDLHGLRAVPLPPMPYQDIRTCASDPKICNLCNFPSLVVRCCRKDETQFVNVTERGLQKGMAVLSEALSFVLHILGRKRTF